MEIGTGTGTGNGTETVTRRGADTRTGTSFTLYYYFFEIPNQETLFEPILVETRLRLGIVISRLPRLLSQRLSTLAKGRMVTAALLQQVA